jgi:NADP-dependent 3-hydroxy acid dehydrogenase YdfG
MEEKLLNKVVIITGASSGIGMACAFKFSDSGARVVLAARNIEKLKDISAQIKLKGGEAHYFKTDVKNINDCKSLIERTVDIYGKIDILINNAGISMRATFIDLDLSVIKEIMDTNLGGTVYCTKFALPYLVKEKGTVIGISSISGLTPLPGRSVYCASKYAMDGFLNTLRLETLKTGLNVLIVHPWFTQSNIRNLALDKNCQPQLKTTKNEDKLISATEVANSIYKATIKRKTDVVLSIKGNFTVLMYKVFPKITARLILNQISKEPDSLF